MRKIRHNVFETNSSSTHAVCINSSLTFQYTPIKTSENYLVFTGGEYGWEWDKFNDPIKKINYYISYLLTIYSDVTYNYPKKYTNRKNYKQRKKEFYFKLNLLKNVIKNFVKIDNIFIRLNCNNSSKYYFNVYVDGGSTSLSNKYLNNIINFNNKKELKEFFFNSKYWIVLGNDNYFPEVDVLDNYYQLNPNTIQILKIEGVNRKLHLSQELFKSDLSALTESIYELFYDHIVYIDNHGNTIYTQCDTLDKSLNLNRAYSSNHNFILNLPVVNFEKKVISLTRMDNRLHEVYMDAFIKRKKSSIFERYCKMFRKYLVLELPFKILDTNNSSNTAYLIRLTNN